MASNKQRNRVFSYGGYQYEVEFSRKINHEMNSGGRFFPRVSSLKERKRIAIIGAGWYGVHIACELKKKHPAWEIILFEKNPKIFSGISGMFGIRLHTGPHYPRSLETRENCHKNYSRTESLFSKILTRTSPAVYARGTIDAAGNPSKVTDEEFERVCREFNFIEKIESNKWHNVTAAYSVKEDSMQVGEPLRHYFVREIKHTDVKLRCSTEITGIEKLKKGYSLSYSKGSKKKEQYCDEVINATSYQALLPNCPLPNVEVVYQVCIALEYKHKVKPLPADPFSFIVMDGWLPCIMPCDNRMDKSKPVSRYILTHGQWTIMATFKTAQEAHQYLAKLHDAFIEQEVKPKCEAEIQRFYPAFCQEFKYKGWKGTVLAKPKTKSEFRSAFTFQDNKSGIIHVFPGKISNVFDAEQDVSNLLEKKAIITQGGIAYPKNSVFARAQTELAEKPQVPSQSTTELQSFPDILPAKKFNFFVRGNNRTNLLNACDCLGADKEEQGMPYYMKHPLNKESSGNLLEDSVLFTHAQTKSAKNIKFSTHNTAEPPSVSALTTTPKKFSLF